VNMDRQVVEARPYACICTPIYAYTACPLSDHHPIGRLQNLAGHVGELVYALSPRYLHVRMPQYVGEDVIELTLGHCRLRELLRAVRNLGRLAVYSINPRRSPVKGERSCELNNAWIVSCRRP